MTMADGRMTPWRTPPLAANGGDLVLEEAYAEELAALRAQAEAEGRAAGIEQATAEIRSRLDAGLAVLLKLPILHLARWSHWSLWRKTRPREAKWLRLLLATGVRESIEEMRLNPFRLDFLGPLPAQPLVMFNRVIYPMVVWVSGQKRFYPNWEVEKIIYIPLRDLFNSKHYARYRLAFEDETTVPQVNTFPCFRYEKENEVELLWGATYRITAAFLDDVFGFAPPDLNSLPEIHGRLSRAYLNNA